jgi:hypothetical protein
MNKEARINELMKGAIDLHIHADPSFMKRSCDIMEAAGECCASGMRAIGVKDHYVSTGVGTYIVNKYMRRVNNQPFDVFGSVCMNNEVGFNPRAIFAALKLGAKFVYLPTIASRPHLKMLADQKSKDPHVVPVKIKSKPQEPMYVLDDNGELKPEIKEIMQIIKDADAVLCTGHADYDEVLAIVKYAREINLERVSLTHLPHFTTMDLNKLDNIVSVGGMAEANLCMLESMTPEQFRLTPDQFCEHIRHFTVERCYLVTDAGSIEVERPAARYRKGIEILIDHGFTDEEIHTLVAVNPAKLVGIKQ